MDGWVEGRTMDTNDGDAVKMGFSSRVTMSSRPYKDHKLSSGDPQIVCVACPANDISIDMQRWSQCNAVIHEVIDGKSTCDPIHYLSC